MDLRDGGAAGVDLIAPYAAADLACAVEVECSRAKVGGSAKQAAIAVRVTSAFRREEGEWKLVHRHADPITTPRHRYTDPTAALTGNRT